MYGLPSKQKSGLKIVPTKVHLISSKKSAKVRSRRHMKELKIAG